MDKAPLKKKERKKPNWKPRDQWRKYQRRGNGGQIDGARSNFYLALRVSGIPRQKSVDSQDRSYARPGG
jgi:hypothetical protein